MNRLLFAVAVVLLLGAGPCHLALPPTGAPATAPGWRPLPAAARARAELRRLAGPGPGRAPPYRRAAFGSQTGADGRWPLLGDGCTLRDLVLRRDLVAAVRRGCRAVGGWLTDPYTGLRAGAAQVQVDHVVALAAAWRAGAWRWSPPRRAAFAADPADLLAVAGSVNQAKGGAGPDRWRPPPGHRCRYAVRWITVAARYRLTVTPTIRHALAALLRGCPY